ncbi:MAG TPA: hypothetical protein VL383_16895 [Gemmatimonadaceae bacterium]|jgi:hypothetical protein|nr:hypothetical protein [Gemmatimonadaceae bacterium]
MDQTDQIDWKAELRKIERQFDGLPAEPAPTESRTQKLPNIREREQTERQITVIGASARLVLVGLLVGALWWWPYANGCGFGLAAFLAAKVMIVVGGLWGAVFAWRNRLVASHVVALAFVFTGLALVAAEVLPRLGYVSIAAMGAPHWRCATGLFQ